MTSTLGKQHKIRSPQRLSRTDGGGKESAGIQESAGIHICLKNNDEGRGDEEGQEGIGSGGEKVLPTQNQHETPTRNPVREEVGKVLPAGQEGRGNEEMSDDTRKILSACIRGVDVTELYSPERINKVCHEFGLRKGSSLDLRTGWNFEEESHRRETRCLSSGALLARCSQFCSA